MLVTVGALVLCVSESVFAYAAWEGLSYILLVVTVCTNDVTLSGWRRERNAQLNEIEDDEAWANRERVLGGDNHLQKTAHGDSH